MSVLIISWQRLAASLKASEKADSHLFLHPPAAPFRQHRRSREIRPLTRATTPPPASALVRPRRHAPSLFIASHPPLASTPKLCRRSTMSSRAGWSGSATQLSLAVIRAKPFFKPSVSSRRSAACLSARLPRASGRTASQASRTSRSRAANGAKSATKAWPKRCRAHRSPPFYFETTFFLLLTNEHVEHLGWAGVGTFYWLPTAQYDDDHRFDDTHPKIPTNGRPASPLRYASIFSYLTPYLLYCYDSNDRIVS